MGFRARPPSLLSLESGHLAQDRNQTGHFESDPPREGSRRVSICHRRTVGHEFVLPFVLPSPLSQRQQPDIATLRVTRCWKRLVLTIHRQPPQKNFPQFL